MKNQCSTSKNMIKKSTFDITCEKFINSKTFLDSPVSIFIQLNTLLLFYSVILKLNLNLPEKYYIVDKR